MDRAQGQPGSIYGAILHQRDGLAGQVQVFDTIIASSTHAEASDCDLVQRFIIDGVFSWFLCKVLEVSCSAIMISSPLQRSRCSVPVFLHTIFSDVMISSIIDAPFCRLRSSVASAVLRRYANAGFTSSFIHEKTIPITLAPIVVPNLYV